MRRDDKGGDTPGQNESSDKPRRRWSRWESDGLSYIQRLWQKVDKRNGPLPEWHPEYGIDWLWLGSLNTRGYGQMAAENSSDPPVRVHVFAYELASGEPVPDGLEVGHTCDNKECVRNDEEGTYTVGDRTFPRWGHLWLGTHQDNLLDMGQKGRRRGPPKSVRPAQLPVRKRRDPRDKITDEQAAEIFERDRAGESQQSIADDMGISQTMVSKIARGKRGTGPGTPTGERHGQSKLSDEARAAIPVRHAAGETQVALAKEYGVSQSRISIICAEANYPPNHTCQ